MGHLVEIKLLSFSFLLFLNSDTIQSLPGEGDGEIEEVSACKMLSEAEVIQGSLSGSEKEETKDTAIEENMGSLDNGAFAKTDEGDPQMMETVPFLPKAEVRFFFFCNDDK